MVTTSPRPVSQNTEVRREQLKTGMTISAYLLDDRDPYKTIDTATCRWVRHNFPETRVRIIRENSTRELPVLDLEPGDTLLEINTFPSSLLTIVQVTEGLIDELKSRGFSRFRVINDHHQPKNSQQPSAGTATKANQRLENTRRSLESGEAAAKALKDVMTAFRQGRYDLDGLMAGIDQLVGEQRPEALTALMSLKTSDQLYAHSVEVGAIFLQAYYPIQRKRGNPALFKDRKEAMLAAMLHDIGKTRLSKAIIESQAPFKKGSTEIQTIRRHVEEGAKLLEDLKLPPYFINMARYHHVKLDRSVDSSYPADVNPDDILFETRLLSLIDTYQALTAGRSYKRRWTPPSVMRYLDAMAGIDFESALWADFLAVMGHYPVGSLVRLSDGTLAFVISVPETDVLNPQVIVVRDAEANDLPVHRWTNLAEQPDLSIQKDVDVHEIFGEKALDAFMALRVA